DRPGLGRREDRRMETEVASHARGQVVFAEPGGARGSLPRVVEAGVGRDVARSGGSEPGPDEQFGEPVAARGGAGIVGAQRGGVGIHGFTPRSAGWWTERMASRALSARPARR